MQSFGKRYSEEEQREIIRLASRLQQESGDSLSGEELLQVAAEAGIKPEYMQQAMLRMESPREAKRGMDVPKALIPMLLVAQWLSLFSMLGNRLTNWSGLQWWLVIGLCFALGTSMSANVKSRWTAVAVTLGSLVLVASLCGLFVSFIAGPVTDYWPRYLFNAAIVELLATTCGGLLGTVLDKILRKPKKATA